jgi:hypothetical protein
MYFYQASRLLIHWVLEVLEHRWPHVTSGSSSTPDVKLPLNICINNRPLPLIRASKPFCFSLHSRKWSGDNTEPLVQGGAALLPARLCVPPCGTAGVCAPNLPPNPLSLSSLPLTNGWQASLGFWSQHSPDVSCLSSSPSSPIVRHQPALQAGGRGRCPLGFASSSSSCNASHWHKAGSIRRIKPTPLHLPYSACNKANQTGCPFRTQECPFHS